MASLFVIQGRDQGTRFPLEDPVYIIGRTHSNAVRLHDTEVSREHAELSTSGNTYLLRDLGSSNGTFVNGRLITEHRLVSGDQVQVGRSLLLFTGLMEGSAEDLSDQIDILPRVDDDGSRIVASLSQSGGSEWLMPGASESSDPWLANARSNLQIMYRTALAVSHTMDIEQLLNRIMEMIFDWVDADRGCVMLKDFETGKLSPKVRRQRRGVRDTDKLTISKTILDYVTEHNEGVLTSNAREDERWDPAQSIVSQGVREAICVPMQGRYHTMGVIYIDTSISPQRMLLNQGKSPQFTEEHLRLMIAIAHQAALAVEDTSYYKALVQAERLAAVGQTIASLSHHIKNILQGVRGGSYLIELGLQDHDKVNGQPGEEESATKAVDTIRKGWAIVERNQDRISALVLDMLTFSKERKPEPQPSSLNEVVDEVVELMTTHAQDQNTKLDWQPAANMPTLMFDPDGIHRAVLNILTNAIDACEEAEEGKVTIQTKYSAEDSTAEVVVSDNGAGIDPEELENIFTVFVSHKGGRGTGLGLPVSQKILKEHGGDILVESQPGQGSTFTLQFPASTVQAEPPQEDLPIQPRVTESTEPEDLVNDSSLH
ncbi:ATP-binding protein [Adhaeretor mobilis]|uniref:histidine kinase n=1 Tax=Adhaeretor mobilis TaxID=1930276 RepID=A0A517MUH2_9BACT|nr:ATP-binding protein [Adhaeretor mobilis]QDS98437.1 Sensor protein ZraS [Adhaeretor mobilis]